MRRFAIAVVVAALALSALAPAISAQEDPTDVYPCFDGETFQVEQGAEIRLFCGWGFNARGLVRAYLTSIERSLVLRDEHGAVIWSRSPKDTAGDWLAPVFSRASDYPPLVCHPDVGGVLMWEYFLELAPGTYTMTETDTLRHPVTDGYHQCWYEGERLSPQPSLFSGTTVSTVTIIVGG